MSHNANVIDSTNPSEEEVNFTVPTAPPSEEHPDHTHVPVATPETVATVEYLPNLVDTDSNLGGIEETKDISGYYDHDSEEMGTQVIEHPFHTAHDTTAAAVSDTVTTTRISGLMPSSVMQRNLADVGTMFDRGNSMFNRNVLAAVTSSSPDRGVTTGLLDPPVTTTISYPGNTFDEFHKHFMQHDVTRFMQEVAGYSSLEVIYRLVRMTTITSMEDVHQIVADGTRAWFTLLGPNSVNSTIALQYHRIAAYVKYIHNYLRGQVDLERMDAVAIRKRSYRSIAPLIQSNLFQRLVARELLDMQIVIKSIKAKQEHEKTMDNIRKTEIEEAQLATKKLRDHAAQVDALRQEEIRQLTEQVHRAAVNPRYNDDSYSHTPVHGNIPPSVPRPHIPTNVQTPNAQPFGRVRGSYQSFDDASVPLSQQPMSQRRYNADLNDSERRRMEQHYDETRGTYRAMQEGATYIAPPIKRESFPTKHTWNGLPETWDSFVQLFEGHWTNQSMDYFLDQEFRTAYTPGLNAYASISHVLPIDPYTQKPAVNERQFRSDSKVIFGGLKTALRMAAGYSHFLLTHQHDGFSAWFTLCSMSQEGTNIHTTANHYRILLAEKYNPAKHTSLVQFVTYKASLFAKLDDLRARHPDSSISVFSDPDKMGQIIDSLGSDVSGNYYQFLDSSMRQGTSFPAFLETLRRLLTYKHQRNVDVADTGPPLTNHITDDDVNESDQTQRYC
jgi:hypothetical protein